jgi:formylglycine-generating enzyme required for sulfatase activity
MMSRSVILFLAANPAGTDPLALDQECAAIERELKLTPGRDDFEFRSKWAVTVDELMRHLLDLSPTIIHFSGHGHATGILLEGDGGRPQPVTPAALTRMIRTTTDSARLAVLNACYSDAQAEALRDAVGCAIGMKGTISDEAAHTFSVGFYRALGHRRPIGNAYDQAEATLAGKGLSAQAEPRCLARPGIDVGTLRIGKPRGRRRRRVQLALEVEAGASRSDGDASRAPVALVMQPAAAARPQDLALNASAATAPLARPPARRIQRASSAAAEADVVSNDPVAAWLRFGLSRHGRVMVVGFRDASIPIDLDRVFVPLYVYADRTRRGKGPDPREDKDEIAHGGKEISFDDALARASEGRTCLALIGDPGAGKTTLLRHLFRRVVSGQMTGPVAHLLGLHPVLVRLATVSDEERVARGLARVIARVACEDGYAEAGAAILARPNQCILFLLDGLDEVRDESTRKRICAWLNDEIDHWPGCGFLVTSRRAAWARTPELSARFLPVSVQGLHQDARDEYVRRWFHAVVRHFFGAIDSPEDVGARASEKAAALLEVLATRTWRTSSRLLEMTANPLMLSTLCLAHYNDTRLPEQRGELYERTLGLLIEVWTRERPGGPTLRFETTRLVLQPLAYAMHEQDRRELSVEEAVVLVAAPLSQVPAVRAVAPTPERFLDLVRDECGVLMSRDLGRIEFVHLSFQEYLAACHVASRRLERVLADRAGDPRWEEVILLAMSRPGVFEPFMTRCLERGDVDAALLRQCLCEANEIWSAPFEVAADRALARMRAPSGSPAAPDELRRLFELVQGHDLPGLVERARLVLESDDRALRAAARVLVGLPDVETGAPREGQPFVEPTTGMAFVWIPGGSFVMGSSKKRGQPNYDREAFDDELPAHRVQLTGFWMSVYPVTNEQYTRFVTETGHEAPNSFSDRRFNDPAQPVVMVSWDDARAFTAWFTTKLTGIVARLPTEAEWEYSARAADGRYYPWGNEPPDESRATFGQPFDTGRPAVVGHTPSGKSPFDVHDLTGNIWEWCLDAWAGYLKIQTHPIDPCHHGDMRGGARVIRGGSWVDEPRSLRSACRLRNPPQYRNQRLGLRVVCGGSRQLDAH